MNTDQSLHRESNPNRRFTKALLDP